jgi:hypothetical protein
MTTLAQRYNDKAKAIMPHSFDDLLVPEDMTRADHIDELVFHRSEYLGGMAGVILALVALDDKAC